MFRAGSSDLGGGDFLSFGVCFAQLCSVIRMDENLQESNEFHKPEWQRRRAQTQAVSAAAAGDAAALVRRSSFGPAATRTADYAHNRNSRSCARRRLSRSFARSVGSSAQRKPNGNRQSAANGISTLACLAACVWPSDRVAQPARR